MSPPRPTPVFWPERARAALGEERWQKAVASPSSLALLAWNVFATLETHADRDWLAYRLQMLGGTAVRAPVRLALWTGRDGEPLLRPSSAYRDALEERGLSPGELKTFTDPIEVPVRVESPEVLMLVDVSLERYPRGAGGRDRILELVDAGVEHARRLGKVLAVGSVYVSGSNGGAEISARMEELRDRSRLEAELAPRPGRQPEILLREVGWQQFLRVWEAEVDHLALPTSPRPFLEHCGRLGLR